MTIAVSITAMLIGFLFAFIFTPLKLSKYKSLNLTINYSNTGSTSATACDSYDWDGVTYTTSGEYSYKNKTQPTMRNKKKYN